MDTNYTIAYQALKIFRDSMLHFIKTQLEDSYNDNWWDQGVRRVFKDEDIDKLENVFNRRFSGISVVTRPGKEYFEILDINYFTNIIQGNWEQAFREHFMGNRERVIAWLKEIVDLRNPVSHPETGDLSKDDVWRCLDSIERILRIVDAESAQQVSQMKTLFNERNVEEDIATLEDVLQKNAPVHFEKLNNIKKIVHKQYTKQFPSIYMGEAMHHYQIITKRLNSLLPTTAKESLGSAETFILLSAVQLHEIGMITDKESPESIKESLDSFHVHTRRKILQEHEYLGISKTEANAIGYICYGHRGERILDVPDELFVESSRKPIRGLYLASLFRLAHTLDLHQRLAVYFRQEGQEYDDKDIQLHLSINPDIWQIKVRSMPNTPQEEALVRRTIETAQNELERTGRFLRNYDLNFHTIGLEIDTSFYKGYIQKPTVSINPYKGLDAFSEKDASLFFGRDKEKNSLLGKVCSYNLITLRGSSGTGKTSLLRAGLIPQLESLEYQVIYTRAYDNPKNSIKDAICQSVFIDDDLRENLFIDFMLAVSRLDYQIVILFDQAEELFTRIPSKLLRQFVDDLSIVTSNPHFNITIVFSLREDYFSAFFDIFSRDIPTLCLPEHTYRLTALDEKSVREAIYKPLPNNMTIEDEVLDRIVEELQDNNFYYPPNVQIVAYQLFENRNQERMKISVGEYEALGGAEKIISNYFMDLVDGYPSKLKSLARNILKLLVTSYEAKAQFSLEEICMNLESSSRQDISELLDQLIKDRLINRVKEKEYELIHDYLAVQIKQQWLTGEELEVKKLKEMLRWRVREWKEFDESLAHLLPVDGMQRLLGHAPDLNLSRNELKYIISSAIKHGTEVTPWLGQLDSKSSVDILASLIVSENLDVKISAVEKMGLTGSVKAIKYLAQALMDENEYVQNAAVKGLKSLPLETMEKGFSEKTSLNLSYILKGAKDWRSAAPVIETLKILETETAAKALQETAYNHDEVYVREGAMKALKQLNREMVTKVLLRLVDTANDEIRCNALSSLKIISSEKVINLLFHMVLAKEEKYRKPAIITLDKIGWENSIAKYRKNNSEKLILKLFNQALEDESTILRQGVSRELRQLQEEEYTKLIPAFLKNEDPLVRQNIVAVLEEMKNKPKAVSILNKLIRDESPEVRQKAIEYLGIYDDKESRLILYGALKDQSSKVRARAAQILGSLQDQNAIEPLIDSLSDSDLNTSREIKKSIGEIFMSDPSAILKNMHTDILKYLEYPVSGTYGQAIIAFGKYYKSIEIIDLGSKDPDTRKKAIKGVKFTHDSRATTPLIFILENDDNSEVRHMAAEVLGILGDERAIDPLIKSLTDENHVVRHMAAQALGILGDERAVGPLIKSLGDINPIVRRRAAEALGAIGDERAAEPLITLLYDENPRVRRCVARELGNLRCEKAVGHLMALVSDNDVLVRRRVTEALNQIGDKRALGVLEIALKDTDLSTRSLASEAIEKIRGHE